MNSDENKGKDVPTRNELMIDVSLFFFCVISFLHFLYGSSNCLFVYSFGTISVFS